MQRSSVTRTRDRRIARLRTLAIAVVSTGAIAACSNSGGSGSANPAFELGTLSPAANDPTVSSPFDATPDLTGHNIYFTAIGANGPGVFQVAASGGPITQLFAGAPFVSPMSIAISSDGATLFVSDIGAQTGNADGGAIFALPVGGGTPTDMGEADGMVPRGLEVAGDILYFTGTSSDRQPGVFAMNVAGGPVSTIAKGMPFQSPSGVTVDKAGNLYVVDAASTNSQHASIYKLPMSGTPTVFVDNIAVGYPAGIVLNMAESELLVSALDPSKGTDVVLTIDVESAAVTPFSTGIGGFVEAAGLHRAHGADIFAWADSRANHTGTVYVISR
jgi:DNA-binding beta-propeller fold protein YncE